MGPFVHLVTLIGPAGVSETVEALVDLDNLFASFSRSLLTRIGARPTRTAPLRLGGHEAVRELGQVDAELDGVRGHLMCIFASDDEPARLGSHSLDSFGLEVDLERRRLVPRVYRLIQHV